MRDASVKDRYAQKRQKGGGGSEAAATPAARGRRRRGTRKTEHNYFVAMNLALHGFLLQVILSTLNFKHGFKLCSAGEPGYLDFDNLPETNFSCQGKVIGGYYADVEAGCQMFHVCTIGQKDEIMDIKFLCLNGTVFDQETRVCERVDEVDCSKSERFYNLNLELYGNNAVTLSLHEEKDDDSTEPRDDHQQQQQQLHMTSTRPSTTSSTTTTQRPSQPSTTSKSNAYQQQPTGYPQHYQPRPAFPSIQTSQSNTHYNDKNGGYHHQYIFHNDERNNNNQATSYQHFSSQGVSSTMTTPPVHQQIRYSSTAAPQVIHNEPSTVTPLQYHIQSTSSTIQTLLNSNVNNPSLINPLFHNHGITSTTEQFNVHNNNPREITEYQDNSDDEQDGQDEHERRSLEAIQSTNKGKVSKLTISPVPQQEGHSSVIQTKSSQISQQHRISINYFPSSSPIETTISEFYPTQTPTSQNSQKLQNNQQILQHIHVPPPPPIPQLKPHQVTINLPPPDIQRIVQNPSPLLPSQSRVIVTAKASVSDESGRPLNSSQLITLPLPTIPSNYDDYKEGDESFDPFYRDVPKIRNDRRIIISSKIEPSKRNLRKKRSNNYDQSYVTYPSEEVIFNAEIKNIKDLRKNLPIIKAILFGLPFPENDKSFKMKNANIDNIHNNESSMIILKNETTKDEQHNDLNITSKSTSKDIKSSSIYNEEIKEKYVDLKIPNNNEKIQSKIRDKLETITQITNIEQKSNPSSSTLERDVTFKPLIVKLDAIDAEHEYTTQIFLNETEDDNFQSNNWNLSTPTELINALNRTVHMNNKTDQIEDELVQPRSSAVSNESNRRKYLNNESDEYLPRSNDNKQKSSKYYEKYNLNESIELTPKYRSNRFRQRSKDKQLINYRHDYSDEEDIENNDYFEDNINKSHKNQSRRGSQGSIILFQNHNRHLNYGGNIEPYKKPKITTNTLNKLNRIRESFHHDRFDEDRKRRSELKNRKNRRQPSVVLNEEIQSKELDSKSKYIDSLISQEENNDRKYSLKNQKNIKDEISSKIFFPVLERNKQSIEKQEDKIEEDYKNEKELYSDENNESKEKNISDHYIDYADSNDQIHETIIENRKNGNRFNNDYEEISRRKSDCQNKSRHYIEKKNVDQDIIEKKINNEYTESTTLQYEQIIKIRNSSTANTVSSETNVFNEYDDYDTEKVISTTDTIINEDLLEHTQISTEGVFKFMDELTLIEKIDELQKDDNENYEVTTTKEDYVDDNYEPDSYIDPVLKEPLSSEQDSNKNNNRRIYFVKDNLKEIKMRNNNMILNNSVIKIKNKEEYDEIYDDTIENTTTSLSSQDYDELEISTDNSFSTTSDPVSSTIEVSNLSSKKNTSINISIPMSIIKTIPLPIMTNTTTPTATKITAIRTTTTPATITTTTTTVTPTSTPFSTTTCIHTPLIISMSDSTTTAITHIPTLITTITSKNITTAATSTTKTTIINSMFTTMITPVITRAKATTKFFKPISFRKNYAYVSPPSTPNSVVIRRGYLLTGLKPMKPPPSYNDLAPKPIIRRIPLLSRTSTTTSKAVILKSESVTELPKHLIEEKTKNIEEHKTSIFSLKNESSFTEAVIDNPISKLLSSIKSKNNEIVSKDSNSRSINVNNKTNMQESSSSLLMKQNLKIFTKESLFNNEVPIQSLGLNYSNNVSEIPVESIIEVSNSKSELMNSNKRIYKLETTTKTLDSNFKISDIQTTTLRTLRPSERRKLELTSVKSQIQKVNQNPKQIAGFNCLEKEMYRFYGDVRDCRLFHYCSPGFTVRQVLDFRFVCEEGTIFDEESQSCRHNVPNPKCIKRTW